MIAPLAEQVNSVVVATKKPLLAVVPELAEHAIGALAELDSHTFESVAAVAAADYVLAAEHAIQDFADIDDIAAAATVAVVAAAVLPPSFASSEETADTRLD